MAILEKRRNRYRIILRLNGKKFSRSIKTTDETEAQSALARINDGLRRVELGILTPPEGADIVTFLFSDGRVIDSPKPPQLRSLQELFDGYFSSLVEGAIEKATLSCMRIHLSHIKRILGRRFLFTETQLGDLRNYVGERLKEKGRRGGKVSSVTARKELNSFRTVWNWAREEGLIQRSFPVRGLKLPKTEEKLAFKTLGEVERRIERGGLSEKQQAELWDAVFLTLPELQQVLAHVGHADLEPVVYPMFAFAAYTGARRSEIIRSQLDDLDFDSRTALIHERKRVPGQISTRRVPLTDELVAALKTWFVSHPGGLHTFALRTDQVGHGLAAPLTPRQMHRRFRLALKGTRWEKLRGWHLFRHSFASNCAARGVDQRIIDSWVGHGSDAMVKRYRHLVPSQEQAAIKQVFG